MRKGIFKMIRNRTTMMFAVAAMASSLGVTAAASAQQGDLEFYNGFDPNKPTIIAAHGWFGSIDYGSTFGRSPSFTQNANVIGWDWNANVFFNITGKARQSGRELANEFYDFLMLNAPNYDQQIQVVGHSLGTHVVLEAGRELREIGRNDPNYAAYQADQVTLVDTGFNTEIPAAINDIDGDYLVPLKLDNYFSIPGAGGTGQAYEGTLANVRIPLDHGDMWWYYFESLDQDAATAIKPCASYGIIGEFADENYGRIGAYLVTGASTPLDLSDDVYRLAP